MKQSRSRLHDPSVSLNKQSTFLYNPHDSIGSNKLHHLNI